MKSATAVSSWVSAQGWHEPEFRAYGFPFDRRIDRFEEALSVIVPLLRVGQVDFEGRYVSARECELRPRGPRPGGPPIMIGALANRPRVLALAARHADIWNAWLSWQANTPDAIVPTLAAVDAACVAVGREPGTLRRSVSIQIDYPDAVPNRAPDAQPLSGSPEQLAETLARLCQYWRRPPADRAQSQHFAFHRTVWIGA